MRYMSKNMEHVKLWLMNERVSRVGIQSRDGTWDPPHKSTLGEWTGWRHLAGSGNLDQWWVACRHSVSWWRVRPSTQVDFRRMNGVTCDWSIGGGPARPGPIKVSVLLSGAHSTIRRRTDNMSLWTYEEKEKNEKEEEEEEEEEEERRRRLRSRKKTKEHRRRLRSIKED